MGKEMAREYGESLAESLAEYWNKYEAGEEIDGQDPAEFLDEMTYGYTLRPGAPFSVILGGGGPSAWLEATLDEDGEPERAELVVTWWSEPARFRSPAIDGLTAYYAERFRGE